MELLTAGWIAVSTNVFSQKDKNCFQIEICACKRNECMVFPSTCVPEGWKIEDFTKCETKSNKINIPMH
ncbi:hypothetical protein [Persephonella sp.]